MNNLVTGGLEGIPVVWREQPFIGPVKSYFVVRENERMPTIAEIINSEVKGIPPWLRENCTVRINGRVVPKDMWHLVRPRIRPGSEAVITIHADLGFGGDDASSKSLIASIAAIAVLVIAAVAAPYIAGAILPLALSTSGTALAITTGAVQVGLAIGGTLAIAALVPPPKAPTEGGPTAAVGDNEGKPASITGNLLAPGASVPRVIGTRRVFPPFICEPLVNLINRETFNLPSIPANLTEGAVQAYEQGEVVFGLAGPHLISDIRLGDVPVAEMENVDYQVVEGLPESIGQGLVGRQGKTIQPNAELRPHVYNANSGNLVANTSFPDGDMPIFTRVTSRNGADEVWMTLTFPESIFNQTNTTIQYGVPLRARFRLRGTSTWNNCPELIVSSIQARPFQVAIKWKWNQIDAFDIAQSNTGFRVAYKHVDGQSSVAPTTPAWDAHSHFVGPGINRLMNTADLGTTGVRNTRVRSHEVVFMLTDGAFPRTDAYEFEIKIGQMFQWSLMAFNDATYIYNGTPFDLFWYYLQAGTPVLVGDASFHHKRCIIVRLSSVWNQNPVPNTQAFATISLRWVNRALGQLSCLASGYVPDWDGTGWNNVTTSSNPATHFRDVLTGDLTTDPLPSDLVNDTELVAWRRFCQERGHTVDTIVDGKAAADVLNLLASVGYARPRLSETWGVLIEKERSSEAPVQVLSPLNSRAFQFERAFSPPPSHLRVRYDEPDDDYREQSFILTNEHAPENSPLRIDEIRYEGITNSGVAARRGLFDLNQLDARMVFYSLQAPVEALVCQRGDLVGVQHDVVNNTAGYARVLDVLHSGGLVSGIRLDGAVPVKSQYGVFSSPHIFAEPHIFDLGARTAVAIRLSDQSSLIKEVTATEALASGLQFAAPFQDPGSAVLEPGNLVTVGRMGSEYGRYLVLDITADADANAKLTLVPEAPNIYNPASKPSAMAIARKLGLTDGLVVCLDAGDVASANPNSPTWPWQYWLDTSGNSNHFFRGASINTTANDPQFNYFADFRDEQNYWFTDGTQYFQEASDGNWDVDFHKAGAKFTLVMITWKPTGGMRIFANRNNATNHGIAVPRSDTDYQLIRSNGSGANVINTFPAGTNNAYSFFGVSLNEAGGAGASHYRVQSNQTGTFNGVMTTPSTNAPTARAYFFQNPDALTLSVAGSRIAVAMIWRRNLGPSDLTSLYSAFQESRYVQTLF